MYTFFPSTHSSDPQKPPTIQQPEVIVGQTNERTNEQAAHEQQQKSGENKCGRRIKKILLVQKILLGSSQCYGWWRGSTKRGHERGKRSDNWKCILDNPEAKSCKNCVEMRNTSEAEAKREQKIVPWTQKKMIVWFDGERVFWVENWSSRMMIFCFSALTYIEHYSVKPAKKEKQCKVRVWKAMAFDRKRRRCGAQCRYGRTLWREAHKARTAAKFTI